MVDTALATSGQVLPQPEISPEAKRFITSARKSVLEAVYQTVMSAAVARGVPMISYTIGKRTDPEEGITKLVCRLRVDYDAKQALDFWDFMSLQLEELVRTFSERDLYIWIDDIAVSVDWR